MKKTIIIPILLFTILGVIGCGNEVSQTCNEPNSELQNDNAIINDNDNYSLSQQIVNIQTDITELADKIEALEAIVFQKPWEAYLNPSYSSSSLEQRIFRLEERISYLEDKIDNNFYLPHQP